MLSLKYMMKYLHVLMPKESNIEISIYFLNDDLNLAWQINLYIE